MMRLHMQRYVTCAFLLMGLCFATASVAKEVKLKLGLGSYLLTVPSGIDVVSYTGEALMVDYMFVDVWSVNLRAYALRKC